MGRSTNTRKEKRRNVKREIWWKLGLKEHGKMEVNGLIVETLNPLSKISKRLILRKKERKMRKMLGGRWIRWKESVIIIIRYREVIKIIILDGERRYDE